MAQTNKKRRRRSSKKRNASGPRPARPANADAAPPADRRVPGSGVSSLKARRDEAPKPIWAPLPVTELLILVGLIVAVVGAIRTTIPMVIGGVLLLGSASIELAAREHFAGYRSHSTVLASLVAVLVVMAVAFGGSLVDVSVPPWLLAVIGVAVLAGALGLLRRAFRRRTGGLSFRV